MDAPKISVLIPMYNRKHYIEDCVNSALNQTFQDYEIIIRDDGSTDGSSEFVEKIYSKEISAGKIKLSRNEKNCGEYVTTNRLIMEAGGKYITILHSDDVYLPHTLQHLYEVAEEYSSDVVHTSYFFNSSKDGLLSKVYPTCWETHPVEQIEVMSDEPAARFSEWVDNGTFCDIMYNILNRKFIVENELFFKFGHRFLSLWWLMSAKIFVKTPIICYVRRDAPDSGTNTKNLSPVKITKTIENFIKMLRYMDELFPKVEFFNNNEEARYIAKAYLLKALDNHSINRWGFYKDGITPELQLAVADAFKKYFGEDYFYPAFLFNMAHVMPYGKSVDKIVVPPPPPLAAAA